MKKLYFIILLACCGSLYAQPQRLDSLLNDPLLKTSEVGIAVFDLTTNEPLFRYQDERLYRPASTQKVITSVTALSQLGTDYTMDTRLQYTGRVENDTLKGNLYLTGALDPELTDADLDSLVSAVVGMGIRHIADTLVADVSLMDSVYWGPGWSWDDAPHSFQPYLSPLMLNKGCVDITLSPAQKDSLPQVVCVPASGYYQIENKAVSRNPQAGKLKVTRNWLTDGNRITVSGDVSRQTTKTLSIYPSQDFFLHTFAERLQEKGVSIGARKFSDAPAEGDTLYIIRRNLTQVLRQALKESDNLCAEAMFFHLAKKYAGHLRLGFEEGTEAVCSFMKDSLGVEPEQYRIADGSGVSLYNYVSPQLLLEYLKYAYRHPNVFPAFYDSLPIAGMDGTLQSRMKKTSAYRKVRAKTGSVTGVSSLAGYAKAANGHLLAFVIINQNVLKLRQARAFQDKVCDALCR